MVVGSLEKRQTFNLTNTLTDKESSGSVFIVEKPDQYLFGFANFTKFTTDIAKKEIKGQPLKWASGYKQVGVFSGKDIEERKTQLESVTMEERPQIIINKNKL